MSKSIIVVEHIATVKKALVVIIEKSKKYTLVGKASNGLETIELVKKHKVDLLILDMDMPYFDGIACVKVLLPLFPNLKVLATSLTNTPSFVHKIYKTRTKGFMLKNSNKNFLFEAVQTILDGKLFFDNKLFEPNKYQSIIKQSRAFIKCLTDKEYEVLQHVLVGKKNEEIAKTFKVSIRTIHSHRRNILSKAGKNNFVSITKLAYENVKLKKIMNEHYSQYHNHMSGLILKEDLTKKEYVVLTEIFKEKTNNEISKSLGISIRTVDSHKLNLLKKFGVNNSIGIIAISIRHGLI